MLRRCHGVHLSRRDAVQAVAEMTGQSRAGRFMRARLMLDDGGA